MRTIIDLPAEQAHLLDRLRAKRRTSRTELIRQAVAQFLERELQHEGKSPFGIWRDREDDGVAYQDKLRREWGP